MSRRTVNTSPDVEDRITEQVLYIAGHSIRNALDWEDRLRSAIRSLADVPGMPVDPAASDRMGLPVRKLVFERTYLIHFWVDDRANVVRVIGFRHGGREPRTGEP